MIVCFKIDVILVFQLIQHVMEVGLVVKNVVIVVAVLMRIAQPVQSFKPRNVWTIMFIHVCARVLLNTNS